MRVDNFLFISLGAIVALFVVIIGSDRIRALRWWIYGFWMIPLLGLFAYKHLHIPIPFVKELNGAVSWFELPGIGTIQTFRVYEDWSSSCRCGYYSKS